MLVLIGETEKLEFKWCVVVFFCLLWKEYLIS